MAYDAQVHEICDGVDDVAQATGVRPVWFRPPGGAFDDTSVRAAASCGISTVVMWRVRVNGARVETWGGPIRRGDIILLHYRRDLALSLASLKTQLDAVGLHPAPLDDYLPYATGSGSTGHT
jgi:peptidoglycan/xylan/chitin deacetylase (PgdA/CDA1 family)